MLPSKLRPCQETYVPWNTGGMGGGQCELEFAHKGPHQLGTYKWARTAEEARLRHEIGRLQTIIYDLEDEFKEAMTRGDS